MERGLSVQLEFPAESLIRHVGNAAGFIQQSNSDSIASRKCLQLAHKILQHVLYVSTETGNLKKFPGCAQLGSNPHVFREELPAPPLAPEIPAGAKNGAPRQKQSPWQRPSIC